MLSTLLLAPAIDRLTPRRLVCIGLLLIGGLCAAIGAVSGAGATDDGGGFWSLGAAAVFFASSTAMLGDG